MTPDVAPHSGPALRPGNPAAAPPTAPAPATEIGEDVGLPVPLESACEPVSDYLSAFELCRAAPVRHLLSRVTLLGSAGAMATMSDAELEQWTRACRAMSARRGRASSADRTWRQLLANARAERGRRGEPIPEPAAGHAGGRADDAW